MGKNLKEGQSTTQPAASPTSKGVIILKSVWGKVEKHKGCRLFRP